MAGDTDRKSVGYKQQKLGAEQPGCDCDARYARGELTDADFGKVRRTVATKNPEDEMFMHVDDPNHPMHSMVGPSTQHSGEAGCACTIQ